MPKCVDCKYCVQEDYGYSNLTVEGTDVDCLLHLNDKFPVDRYYYEEPVLKEEIDCPRYTPGDGPCIDVERDCMGWGENKVSMGEAYGNDDPELEELLNKRFGIRGDL